MAATQDAITDIPAYETMTHYEYALLSCQSYERNGGVPPSGWSKITYRSRYPENEMGFAATTYKNDSKKCIVIAFRGTVFTEEDGYDLVLTPDLYNDEMGVSIEERKIYLVKKESEYSLCLMSSLQGSANDLNAGMEKSKIYIDPDSYKYKVLRHDGEICEGTLPENIDLSDLSLELELKPQILDYTSKQGHTQENREINFYLKDPSNTVIQGYIQLDEPIEITSECLYDYKLKIIKKISKKIENIESGNYLTLWNIKTDFNLIFLEIPNTIDYAHNHVESVIKEAPDGYHISLTGHSLGAVLAEIMACRFRLPAVTFESPGSRTLIENDELCVQKSDEADIIEYLTGPNAVNTLSPHAGKCFRLYVPHTNGVSMKHAALCVWGTTSRALTYFSAYGIGKEIFKIGSYQAARQTAQGVTPRVMTQGTIITNTGNTAVKLTAPLVEKVTFWGRFNVATVKPLLYHAVFNIATTINLTELVSRQPVASFSWLLEQHSISNILKTFDIETGSPKRVSRINSWPKLELANLLSMETLTDMGRELVPFHPSNRGLHTLYAEETIVENYISRMSGYEVSDNLIEASKEEEKQEIGFGHS